MPDTAVVIGILLAILGIYGFFGSHMEHPTALIPTGFGVVLIILGALAQRKASANTSCTRRQPSASWAFWPARGGFSTYSQRAAM